jgi:hypothetical protein
MSSVAYGFVALTLALHSLPSRALDGSCALVLMASCVYGFVAWKLTLHVLHTQAPGDVGAF